MSTNQILLRIHKDSSGNDVFIDNMSLESAKTFQSLLESFMVLAELYNQNSDTRICLSKGSAELALKTSSQTLSIIENDFNAMFENNSSKNEIVTPCAHIQTIIRSMPYQYEMVVIKSNGTRRSILNEFKRKQKFYAKRATRTRRISLLEFVHGELFDLGGKKINFHIMPPDANDGLIINCSTKEQARRVRNYVYSQVYVVVHAKKSRSGTIREFVDVYNDKTQYEKFRNFYISIQDLEGSDRYTEFHNAVKNELENSTDIEMSLKFIRKYVRLFDNDWTEVGQLRTILIALKAFRNTEILSEILSSITLRLKALTGQEKI